MPVALISIGVVALVAALRGTHNEVAKLFLEDLVEAKKFGMWIGAILVIGILARVARLDDAGKMLTALITVTFLLTRENFWTQAGSAFENLSGGKPAEEVKIGKAVNASSGGGTGASPGGGTGASPGGGTGASPGGGSPKAKGSPITGLLGQAQGLIGGLF